VVAISNSGSFEHFRDDAPQSGEIVPDTVGPCHIYNRESAWMNSDINCLLPSDRNVDYMLRAQCMTSPSK